MKRGHAYVLAFCIVAAVVVAIGIGYYFGYISLPPPTPPGSEPEVAIKTSVKVVNPFLGNPYISEISSEQVTVPYVQPMASVMIFPWEGTLVLKITYPDGAETTTSQKISVDLGGDVTVYFIWKTKQSGNHALLATLYDNNGVLVNQKTSQIFVPPR